jgi:sulfofructose kinase
MPPSAPQVCVIGNNTADLVFTTRTNPESGQKAQAESLQILAGGQAANAAFTMAALGLRIRYLGAFGDDAFGILSRNSLDDIGVDTSYSRIVPNCPNHVAAVWVNAENHDRTIVMRKDPRLSLDEWDADRRLIDDCDALYVDGQEPILSSAMARIAREEDMPVVADAENVSPEVRELIRHTSTLIAPLRVLSELTGTTNRSVALAQAPRLGPSTVIATMGACGCECGDAGEQYHVPAAPCRPVDTTGAGDAFHAGFVAARLHGLPVRLSAEFATRVAALKCECPGPRLVGAAIEQARRQLLSLFSLKP